ncbi:hypothetical protein [Paenibacillus lemnae]|uniref:DUF3221 domain-containing protein n=1 Tax=Paenibacillus lemnae TaxID=1330551 RepID=A0A848M1V9_PAELE|nr:hypothetical protein [Paenibacillus lemnae]NMO94735.1 hypothetical protein [Paenibacillus lemnae]
MSHKLKLFTIVLLIVLAGCSDDKNIFHVKGTIEKINLEDKQIYVDGFWLPVQDIDSFELGDVVAAEVKSRAPGDSYNPKHTIIHNINPTKPTGTPIK